MASWPPCAIELTYMQYDSEAVPHFLETLSVRECSLNKVNASLKTQKQIMKKNAGLLLASRHRLDFLREVLIPLRASSR